MQSTRLLIAAALAASTLLAACGSGDDAPPPVTVVTEDLKVATTASTVKALSGADLSYPNGVPAFGTTGTTTLKITAPASGSPTFAIASGGGTATGNMGFGSCIFTITQSSIPSLPANTQVTVNPCTLTVGTSGDPVGTAPQPVKLILGATESREVTLIVAISPTGDVTISSVDGQTVDAGDVKTTTATGGS